MKRLVTLTLALVLLLTAVTALAGCNKYSIPVTIETVREITAEEATQLSGAEVDATNGHRFVSMVVKDYGTIVLVLYPEYAPKTVENFMKLVNSGFYDGLIFHRVISGFMIQGGDPNGDGTGGAEEQIEGEFSENGFKKNTLSHKRGVISMARSMMPNSASSQFFIVHKDSTFLDGSYAAFGEVLSGMDVVDKIASVPTDQNDRPVKK